MAAGNGPDARLSRPAGVSATHHHSRRLRSRPRLPQRSRPGGPHRRCGDIARHASRCRNHYRRRHPHRNQYDCSATTGGHPAEPQADDRGTRRAGPLPRHRDARARPGRDDRDRVANLGRRRHVVDRARHLRCRWGDRADRWHDGGHCDHPPPTRPAVKGFRSCPASGRPRTRSRRGAAAVADRQGRSGQLRTPRSDSSALR